MAWWPGYRPHPSIWYTLPLLAHLQETVLLLENTDQSLPPYWFLVIFWHFEYIRCRHALMLSNVVIICWAHKWKISKNCILKMRLQHWVLSIILSRVIQSQDSRPSINSSPSYKLTLTDSSGPSDIPSGNLYVLVTDGNGNVSGVCLIVSIECSIVHIIPHKVTICQSR